ncbi:MAG: hypothetical protein KAT15_01290, partial [Bacteroidales bacterium]|nr:hypothetical protein [Bacteroidales bacterium]
MVYRDNSGIYLQIKVILIFLLFTPVLIAQVPRDSGMVRYNFDYEFRDGFYANIEMVKANRPIPPARVVSDLDRFDHEFYKRILSAEDIFMYDDQGVQVFLKSKDVWGYAYKGVIYIQVGNRFHRLILDGNISRFMASSTTWEKFYASPGDSSAYQPITSGPNNWRRPIYTYTTRGGAVYLLDFEMNVMKAYYPE